jgi:hypothetical protein
VQHVAGAALDAGVVLHRLAPADGAGLERLFFELTSTPELAGALA